MNDYQERLDLNLKTRIRELAEQISGAGNEAARVPPLAALLQAALKNEWETTLLSSMWVTDERDPEFRVALARLAGDEAKHYMFIEKRLRELEAMPPVADLDRRTPLFHFLTKQKDTFARVVSGPYTREALAVARNEVFLEHCRELDDPATIEIYDQIQADEEYHHDLGRRLLAPLLQSETDLKRATEIMFATLQVVDDIQEMIVMQKGLCRIPGC